MHKVAHCLNSIFKKSQQWKLLILLQVCLAVSFNHVLRFLGTTLTLNKDSARDGTELRNCEGKTVRIWQKPELGERQVS